MYMIIMLNRDGTVLLSFYTVIFLFLPQIRSHSFLIIMLQYYAPYYAPYALNILLERGLKRVKYFCEREKVQVRGLLSLRFLSQEILPPLMFALYQGV